MQGHAAGDGVSTKADRGLVHCTLMFQILYILSPRSQEEMLAKQQQLQRGHIEARILDCCGPSQFYFLRLLTVTVIALGFGLILAIRKSVYIHVRIY